MNKLAIKITQKYRGRGDGRTTNDTHKHKNISKRDLTCLL